jgi:hypothetical protein
MLFTQGKTINFEGERELDDMKIFLRENSPAYQKFNSEHIEKGDKKEDKKEDESKTEL